MTYNEKIEKQTLRIVELIEPALRRRKGRYPTSWGMKTGKGLEASIFNILVDLDQRYETERR
jgi:hypothetical protein